MYFSLVCTYLIAELSKKVTMSCDAAEYFFHLKVMWRHAGVQFEEYLYSYFPELCELQDITSAEAVDYGVSVNDESDVDDFEGLLNGNDVKLSEVGPDSMVQLTFDDPQPVMDLELKFKYVKKFTLVFQVVNETDIEKVS